MPENPSKIADWSRIKPVTETILGPRIQAVHFRRVLKEAMQDERCADLCQRPADVVLKEVPATLVMADGERVKLPDEIDTAHLEAALKSYRFSAEQIRYLANTRRRLALCMDCARRRISEK